MKRHFLISTLLFIAFFSSCKSSTTIEESQVGIIRGSVVLNENCQPLPNRSGATISVQGTSFSTTSDASGNWLISNVPAGIYNILISKSGFDTDLIAQYQFSGAGTQFLENRTLSMITPLLDSVLISSIQVSRRDSIDVNTSHGDSLGIDTSKTYYDTVGHIYSITILFNLNGVDSAIRFEPSFKDIAPERSLYEYMDTTHLTSSPIVRNQTDTGAGTIYSWLWTYPPGTYRNESPHPGDTIVITTQPIPYCEGRKVITQSKSFVLP